MLQKQLLIRLAESVNSIGLVLTMASMDSSIIAVAVPSLTAHWHSIKDVGWYSTA